MGLDYVFDRGRVTIDAHPALIPPHLLAQSLTDTPQSILGGYEPVIIGSGSTKKAAFSAAFSSGGPIETYSERLWEFFSVKQSFVYVPASEASYSDFHRCLVIVCSET